MSFLLVVRILPLTLTNPVLSARFASPSSVALGLIVFVFYFKHAQIILNLLTGRSSCYLVSKLAQSIVRTKNLYYSCLQSKPVFSEPLSLFLEA